MENTPKRSLKTADVVYEPWLNEFRVLAGGTRHFRHPLPIQLRSLCHSFHEVLSRRFPEEATAALGMVLFLRFINPTLGKRRRSGNSGASVLADRPAVFDTASHFTANNSSQSI